MKDKIHPNYIEDQKITCACGNIIIAGSTRKDLRTEICSACHPFYTGHQKLLDTAGRVDKFMAKVKKAQKIKESKVKEVDEELDEVFDHEPKAEKEAAPAEEAVQTTLDLDQEQEEQEAKPAKKAVKAVAKKAPAKKAAAKKPAAPTKKVAK